MAQELNIADCTTNPTDFTDCLDYLSALYSELKENNSKYSYKKYAQLLGVGAPGNLHNILNRKRALSEKNGTKIATALQLKGDQREYFLLLVQVLNTKDSHARESLIEQMIELRKKNGSGISDDQMELCRDWYHLVVREILSLPDVSQSPQDIANMIVPKLRPGQVEKSIALLMRLGMVVYNIKSGRLEATSDHVKTGAETEGMLVIKFHQSMLDISKNAIDAISEEDREISASTIRLSASKIKEIKKKIYDLQMEVLAAESEPNVTDQIFQLNFQLFPVSQKLSDSNSGKDESCESGTDKSA